MDFSEVTTFNLDEYVGLNHEHEQSYYYFMMENLFRHINVPHSQIHVLSGTAEDPVAECLAYEENIRAAGGIDLQILGIGRNGHIAFNEPSSMGIGSIMQARSIVLIATGSDKAQAVKDMITGPVTPRCPASVLQLHPSVNIMLDNEAASLL